MTASLSMVASYLRQGREGDRRLTDGELLDRSAVVRDESAFAELVRRHGPMVLSVCRRVLRQEQDAEDAFQATFLVLARKASSIRRGDSVAGWLFQVARRLALRARATTHRRREQPTPPEVLGATPADLPCDADMLGTSLDEELQRLPEHYRSAVILCYLEGRSQTEAARLLTTTASAVNSRLKRARELLRKRLVRRGLSGLSVGAVAERVLGGALAARATQAAHLSVLSPILVRRVARTALDLATNPTAAQPAHPAEALAAGLETGALRSMLIPKVKIVSTVALVLAMALASAGGVLVPSPVQGEAAVNFPLSQPPQPKPRPARPDKPKEKEKPRPAVILVWLSGGPSQIDTFDPKPEDPNGGLFGAVDTNVKGVKISNVLPRLAKAANRLTLIRSMTHRNADHTGGTYVMRTGRERDGNIEYPSLGSVLAKELGEGRPSLPGYVILGWTPFSPGAGFLGPRYQPVMVTERAGIYMLPADGAFEALDKKEGKAMRRAIGKAFDLGDEQEKVHVAYGRSRFGQGCLLARRLIEAGVPVVEVHFGGWDTHANAQAAIVRLGGDLDAGLSALLKDLAERKRLDSTLVVCMGEFGRTPKINQAVGRDHWVTGFSVVLAGAGLKGGQVIGSTSADGTRITARPVSPAELHATIYQALGIDPGKENRTPTGLKIPLVDKGTKPVKEALR
jgi:RNA polymerase sigma factor (sigma-70 family)